VAGPLRCGRSIMTKYEALEKNVVSNRKFPSLRQSLVRSVTQKVSVCWGFWGWSTVIDSRLPGSIGGGRGTGIEPSPRSQEWSMGPGGPLEVHDPGQNGRRLKESQTAVPGDHPASTWHWDPCQTHIEPAD
jgi:hypothetical protein